MGTLDFETSALIVDLRRIGTDRPDVEVKSAAGGLPKNVVETLSAFANGSGGTLLLGLDESRGFVPSDGFDARRVRDALAGACADQLDPPIRVPITIEDFEGALIVRADVPELDPIEKPCFVKTRGEYQGSFIRGGDGDRKLNHYEVSQLLSNRTQPQYDSEPVAKATVADLDRELVTGLLAHARRRSPRSFADVDEITALKRLGALAEVDGSTHPTLAGLLSLGSYPQQYFPQLFVSFVVVPGIAMGDTSPDGKRFLDNVSIDGPIPAVVEDAMSALRRNMKTAAIVRGLTREDRYDYPLDALRELLVNALMHRDYSPGARGTQVQIEMFIDRLVIKSPGGLYGSVTVDQLGTSVQATTSRNAALARLLADLPLPESRDGLLCENRGSGLPIVMAALRDAGMSPPIFDAAPGHLHVSVPQHALLSTETIEWIGGLGQDGLTDHQHLALAMMRANGRVSNAMLQTWGAERLAASTALRGLVERGLARKHGGKRYAVYELTATALEPPAAGAKAGTLPQSKSATTEAELAAIEAAIREGFDTARALETRLGMGYQTILRRIAILLQRGRIARTAPMGSKHQSYRLTKGQQR